MKVCAIPYRQTASGLEVLIFRHPLAGVQFVKGGREAGETPLAGARRELAEESGLCADLPALLLGELRPAEPTTPWLVFAFEMRDAPDRWSFRTSDDGGRTFTFSWHPIEAEPCADWHLPFKRVLAHVREALPAALAKCPQPGAGPQ